LIIPCLVSCQSADLIPYLAKQGFGQGSLILKSRSIEEVLKDPNTRSQVLASLTLATDVVKFAESEMDMKTGKNYRRFVELQRPYVTQIVTAAHKDKLESFLFSYPIFGKLPYKGFFDEADAIALEESLKTQGYDTYRRPVEAFSTAGWLPDPLTSAMLSSPARLIELLFHELTHSTFYFSGEADFNEAFASWMGYQTALVYIEKSTRPDKDVLKKELTDGKEFQTELSRVVKSVLAHGKLAYGQSDSKNLEKTRNEFFAWAKSEFEKSPILKKWGQKQEWNNARLLALGTYYSQVPKIEEYANKNNLGPKEFLKLVEESGSTIIQKIF
jgi:predicted aminopeptidase